MAYRVKKENAYLYKQGEKRLLNPKTLTLLLIKVLNSIIEDAIYEDVYTICSSYMVAATTKRKKDAIILTWLQVRNKGGWNFSDQSRPKVY